MALPPRRPALCTSGPPDRDAPEGVPPLPSSLAACTDMVCLEVFWCSGPPRPTLCETRRTPEHLAVLSRFLASGLCLVGENPTCKVPALFTGMRAAMFLRLRAMNDRSTPPFFPGEILSQVVLHSMTAKRVQIQFVPRTLRHALWSNPDVCRSFFMGTHGTCVGRRENATRGGFGAVPAATLFQPDSWKSMPHHCVGAKAGSVAAATVHFRSWKGETTSRTARRLWTRGRRPSKRCAGQGY